MNDVLQYCRVQHDSVNENTLTECCWGGGGGFAKFSRKLCFLLAEAALNTPDKKKIVMRCNSRSKGWWQTLSGTYRVQKRTPSPARAGLTYYDTTSTMYYCERNHDSGGGGGGGLLLLAVLLPLRASPQGEGLAVCPPLSSAIAVGFLYTVSTSPTGSTFGACPCDLCPVRLVPRRVVETPLTGGLRKLVTPPGSGNESSVKAPNVLPVRDADGTLQSKLTPFAAA